MDFGIPSIPPTSPILPSQGSGDVFLNWSSVQNSMQGLMQQQGNGNPWTWLGSLQGFVNAIKPLAWNSGDQAFESEMDSLQGTINTAFNDVQTSNVWALSGSFGQGGDFNKIADRIVLAFQAAPPIMSEQSIMAALQGTLHNSGVSSGKVDTLTYLFNPNCLPDDSVDAGSVEYFQGEAAGYESVYQLFNPNLSPDNRFVASPSTVLTQFYNAAYAALIPALHQYTLTDPSNTALLQSNTAGIFGAANALINKFWGSKS